MHLKITGFGGTLLDQDTPLPVLLGVTLLVVLVSIAACRAARLAPAPSSAPLEYVTKPADAAPWNFGPASARDQIVFTSERPGIGAAGNTAEPETWERSGWIPTAEVEMWAAFMQAQQVRRVLVLLDANELAHYAAPLLETYEALGLAATWVPMGAADAKARVHAALAAAEAAGERIVAHCTHGMGRSGRVAAGWLALRYGLSPEDATAEALAAAEEHALVRLGNARKLAAWLDGS